MSACPVSTLLTAKNLSNLNANLMEFIKGKNNNFDLESETIDNQITFTNDGEDGLVQDRFFGFKNGKDEQELCSVLYNRFKRICSDVKKANLSNKDYNNFFISENHHCDPDTMKLVIGHCVQNKATNDKDNIFESSF